MVSSERPGDAADSSGCGPEPDGGAARDRKACAAERSGYHAGGKSDWRGARWRPRKLVQIVFEQRERDKYNDCDSRSHEGQRRIVKINPAQVRGQGDNRWSGERAQTGGEADNEAKYESDGGGHSASLLRKYPWNISPARDQL